MVMQNNDTPLTPPADDQSTFSQVVPDMSQLAAEAAAVQKLLANVQLQPLPGMQGYNPNLVALLPHLAQYSPLQIYQAQIHAAQQQLLQHQLQAHLLAAQQEHQRQLQSAPQQPMWMQGGSISASPAHISDSEISELSELSPPPSTQRPHSPFKDPHRLADPSMMALMSLSKLSEREQLAVNILVEMATDVR